MAKKTTKPKAKTARAKKPTEPSVSDILRARLRARPSVTTIAARAGVSDGVLSKFLRGLHVRSDTLDKIARALEMRLVAIEEIAPAPAAATAADDQAE